MEHDRPCVWTLIMCMWFTRQPLATCSVANCHQALRGLDDSEYEFYPFHFYIFEPDHIYILANGSALTYKLNDVSGHLDNATLHFCCQYITYGSNSVWLMTGNNSTSRNFSELVYFLKHHLASFHFFRFSLLYNLCYVVWKHSYMNLNNVKFYFTLQKRQSTNNLEADISSTSALCFLMREKNVNKELEHITKNKLTADINRKNFSEEKYIRNMKQVIVNCSATSCGLKLRQKRQALCEPFKFGEGCTLQCHCAQLNLCSNPSGQCLHNLCQFGWKLSNCSLRICPQDSYAVYLDNHCHKCGCRDNGDCHIITGECNKPCETEMDCNRQICHRHFFSPPNCNRQCHCVASSECHPITGECSMESCSTLEMRAPTCSNEITPFDLWETASVLIILASIVLIKFIIFLVF